jgi:hypothetical protein
MESRNLCHEIKCPYGYVISHPTSKAHAISRQYRNLHLVLRQQQPVMVTCVLTFMVFRLAGPPSLHCFLRVLSSIAATATDMEANPAFPMLTVMSR